MVFMKTNEQKMSTEQKLWENRIISTESNEITDEMMEKEEYVTEENDHLGLKRYAITTSLMDTLSSLIATYNRLIFHESERDNPDIEKINQWENKKFEIIDINRNPENFQQFIAMDALEQKYLPYLHALVKEEKKTH